MHDQNAGKTIGIIQPNYIPWRGYFDFINDVDVFVFLDDVQYTRQDWRNRNRVRTRGGQSIWLTVPVLGGINQLIKDARIDTSKNWYEGHLATLTQSYGKAPYFSDYIGRLGSIFFRGYELLSQLTIDLTTEIAGWLGIQTQFIVASDLGMTGVKDEKLIQIVRKLGGNSYLSGPAAKAYLQPHLWTGAGVQLRFKSYPDYPAYPQIAEPFEPAVSILDLMFMVGPRAPEYIWKASLG